MYAGIATHFCPSNKIEALEQALIDLENADEIERVLYEFCLHTDDGDFSLAKYLKRIDACFSAPTIEEILCNLENDGSDWAKQTIKVSCYFSTPTFLLMKIFGEAVYRDTKIPFD